MEFMNENAKSSWLQKPPFTVLQEYVTVEVLNIQPLNIA